MNNNKIRQELSEFTLVELVGYEDDETRNPMSFSLRGGSDMVQARAKELCGAK